MFETIIEGQASGRKGSKKTVLISLALHVIALSILVTVPLIYYQSLPGGWEVLADVIFAPPPTPAPPAPPPSTQTVVQAQTVRTGPVVVRVPLLIEPSNVPLPPDIAEIDLPLENIIPGPADRTGTFIPSGISGPTNFGGVFRPTGPAVPPPPPPKPPRQPLLISVLDPSKVIYRVEPVYPTLAIQARVQGSVMLQVTVNEMGIVESVQVVRGHPLLNEAAITAVKQWRYKPTILNGEPMPITATVTVNFNLQNR
ncbi:MAG: energy transducer TonB [Acidobacteria bacterium]|nr:MAG: energy transducer TonB [Acidobacteriota bacterium]